MSDVEKTEAIESEPIETEPMNMVTTLDVRDASAQGLALMKERVENQKQMLKIAIGLTAPNQWVAFGESLYPTGGAADTILRRAFGLTWGEKTITIEDTPDGRLATCSAWLMRGGEKVEHFTGYRLMGGFIKTEADLRRSVLENLKSVAVRDLLGLRFRTPAEIKEMGLDVSKLERRVEFQDRTGQEDPGLAVVPFGKNKGKPIAELGDKSLDWYIGAAEKNILDPDKAKWKAKEERWLSVLMEEKNRRHQKEKPSEDYANVGPPPMEEHVEF